MSYNAGIIQQLNQLNYATIPANFYDQVEVWRSWYVGDVKNFHRYKRYNGNKWVGCRRATLGMGKKVCEDWANLLMNEKVKITLEGEKEQQFVDRILSENNFSVKANEMQEMKSALGTVAYVPRVTGQAVNDSGEAIPGNADGIIIDYVTIDNIFPLSWENGIIRECAFSSMVTRDGKSYIYLQIHRKNEDDGKYDIENRIYQASNGILTETDLGAVRGFERIPRVVHTGSDRRQFVIDRPNIANNVDYRLPVGISVFANAVDALRGVDSVPMIAM